MTCDLDRLQQRHLEALEQSYAAALQRRHLDGVLLYSGHPRHHFGDDQAASFATFAHFLHWVPIPGLAFSWLLIRPGERPRLYFHAPDDFWHLPARLPEEAWVERVAVERGRFERPPPLPAGRFAVIGEVSAEATGIPEDRVNPPDLVAVLDEGRVRKSDYELACLAEANRLAVAGHLAARDAFLDGGAELDVQLAYLGASRQRESELPYGNIVGINAHGGVLHYQHYDIDSPARRHSLLVDAGHRHRGYCADITRTWPGPQADKHFTALVDGMARLQQELIAALRSGVDFVTLHERMHHLLAEVLVEHRLVRCSEEAAVDTGITRAFCPHGLGHLLGLQVHDVAGRSDPEGRPLPPPAADPALRLTRPLETGMVVTIEPGCYFIPSLLDPLKMSPAGADIDWQGVERLAPHGGIRIEDNLCITDQAAENLTPGLGG